MKKAIAIFLVLIMTFVCFTGCSSSGSEDVKFPAKDISGIVQWGEGGGTDNIVRPLCIETDKLMDVNIVVQNMTGATGAIATQYVHDSKADGHTILLGAENPALYEILGTSKLTYDNFETILLIGSEDVSIVVPKDSPYNSVTDVINAAKAAPGKLIFSATGQGGCQWQSCGLIGAVTGAEFTQLPLDGDADCLAAVMGGTADVTTIKSSQVMEAYKAGTVKVLATLTSQQVEVLPGVKPITEELPDFAEYLPFGPFYGVFVPEDTPQEAIDYLIEKFSAAFETESYQTILSNLNVVPLGLKGEDANQYIANWTLSTAKALYKAGLIQQSPAELGLE